MGPHRSRPLGLFDNGSLPIQNRRVSTISLLEAVLESGGPTAVRFDEGRPFSNRLAVLPSAFNPPTVAHLALLEVARSLPGAGAACALLTTRNVDKGLTGAAFADRVGMLLAVNEAHHWLGVVATNQARIIDQEAALAVAFPGVEFDFVVGYDTLVRLFDPRYYSAMDDELAPFFERARVIALNRGEAGTAAVRAFVEREAAHFAERIVVAELDAHPASLSSTLARAAFREGSSTTAVPPAVARYIEEHQLYR